MQKPRSGERSAGDEMSSVSEHKAANDPEDVAMDYLASQEAGESPNLGDYESKLEIPEQRREFRDLIEAATLAQSHFPAQLRSEHLLDGRYRLPGLRGQRRAAERLRYVLVHLEPDAY